jgi:hypothetical protein
MAASIGERVRIPEGFKEGGVLFKNGDLPKIAAIDSERVTFEDGRSVANDFLHVDQAHCVTGYSTECRTVDIYIGLAPMTALGAVTATDVYVGTTRARQKAIWYTDNKEEFREAAVRDEERKSPFDFEQVVTQAHAMTKDVEKIKAVDLQQDKQVSEKEKVRIEPQNNVGNVTNISPDLAGPRAGGVAEATRCCAVFAGRATQPRKTMGNGQMIGQMTTLAELEGSSGWDGLDVLSVQMLTP